MKLKSKLLLSFFLVTCLSSIATTVFSIYYFSDKIHTEAQETMRKHMRVAQRVYEEKMQDIGTAAANLSSEKKLLLLVELKTREKIQDLLDNKRKTIDAQQIVIVDSQQKLLSQVGLPLLVTLNNLHYSQNILLRRALSEHRLVIGTEVIQLKGQSFLSISAAAPLQPSGQIKDNALSNQRPVTGALLVRYILNNNHYLAEQIKNLLDVNTVIFHQDKGICFSDLNHDAPILPQIVSHAFDRGQAAYAQASYLISPQSDLAEYRTIKDVQGNTIAVLGISMKVQRYTEMIFQAMGNMLGIMVLCILLASLLGYFLSRNLLVPIFQLLTGVKRITSGDLNHEIRLNHKDELGQLAHAFNSMSKQLKELFNTLEQRVDSATEELQSTSAHLSAIIDNIADGLLVTNAEGQIIRVNPAFSRMFPSPMGWLNASCEQLDGVLAELVSHSCQVYDIVHTAEIPLAKQHIGQAVVSAIMHSDNAKLGIHYIGSVVLIRDITQEKAADLRLKTTVETLTQVGVALSAENDLDALLEMLVCEARRVCHADGGSLYTQENQQLQFKIVQNESLNIFMGGSKNPINLAPLALDDNKVSAYSVKHKETVLSPNVYEDKRFDFSGTYQYDDKMNYRTNAMLTVPLLDRHKRAVGVLQLINPTDQKNNTQQAFQQTHIDIINALASQAAVAIENARSYEQIQRKKAAFERFVPTEFLHHLGKQEVEDIVLGDAKQANMSVLFSDIRAFTQLSESMTAAETFLFLNEYLHEICPNIVGQSGFIDKYIGDAIMALFPYEISQNTDHAVAAAIGMLESLKQFNHQRQAKNLAPVQIGIGIHSGELTLGTIGFKQRLESTVIGDTVNLASRIEGLTKQYNVDIVITEATKQSLSDEMFLVRELDTVQVKGKEQAIKIYEVFNADEASLREKKRNSLVQYTAALQYYHQREWTAAATIFQTLQIQLPDDIVLQMYCKRCTDLLTNPPDDTWLGITRMTSK